eukprot:SAG22_NODE_336_length_12071_cov_10.875125_11_plen_126_part_00
MRRRHTYVAGLAFLYGNLRKPCVCLDMRVSWCVLETAPPPSLPRAHLLCAFAQTERTAMMVAAGGVSFAAITFVVGTFGDPMPVRARMLSSEHSRRRLSSPPARFVPFPPGVGALWAGAAVVPNG